MEKRKPLSAIKLIPSRSVHSHAVVSGFRFHKSKIIVLGVLALFCMSFRLLITPDPPPAANTGSPGDGADCSGCHSDFALNSGTGTVTITSNIPACGYVPLATYSVTATITHNGLGEFQFQLSPQSISGAALGVLHASTRTQLYGGTPPAAQYISGTAASLSNTNSNSWTFTWTAPAASTGPVTFYAAFIAANGDGVETGDYVYTKSHVVPEAGSFSASITVTNVMCNSLCTGSASVSALCGTTPYKYAWSTSPVQTTQTSTGLCAGSYTVVVTDASLANTTTTVTITQPTALTIDMDSTNETVTGNGTATATPSGGTPPYNYMWTPGTQTTSVATGLIGGNYTVVVTDAKSCIHTNTVVVNHTVGIVAADIFHSVIAYPNPSTGNFYIEINVLTYEEFILNVMDVTGKTVYSEMMQLSKGKNIKQISLEPESKGVFFIQLKTKNGLIKIIPIAKM